MTKVSRLLLVVVPVFCVTVAGATIALAQGTGTTPGTVPGVTTTGTGSGVSAGTGVGSSPTTISSQGFLGTMGATVGCNATDPSTNLGALVTFFICTLSRYATAIAVLIIMAAGVMYVLSGSNPALAGTAKSMVVTTITGLVAMYSISLVLKILIESGIVRTTS